MISPYPPVIKIVQDLIRFPSITPHDAGCLDYIENYLMPLGFNCQRLDQAGTSNLFSKISRGGKHYCFAGHTDVVPLIDETLWTYPPFAAEIHKGKVYGRGAVDMKGAIAAFLAALPALLQKHPNDSFSVLLTSDEEGDATFGTKTVVEWLQQKNERIDLCLVGEPTSVHCVGDTLKIGRRGSLSGTLTVHGEAGHVAYPHLAKNPIPEMVRFLESMQEPLDTGMEGFDPSHLEITSIDVNNPTRNVIPGAVTVLFNIRFNPIHTAESLSEKFNILANQCLTDYTLTFKSSGDAFFGGAQDIVHVYADKISKRTGYPVTLGTSGGTSDARFIKDLCPVIELGLMNATAHHIDEHASVSDLIFLQKIYEDLF